MLKFIYIIPKERAKLHIVVCLKQVPDTTEVKIDPKTNTLVREGVPSIANPFDLHALEAALAIKDAYGAKITILCMGPPQAKDAIQKGISMGADEGILLSDRAFAGADTLATSYALSQAIIKIKEMDGITPNPAKGVDIVICGKQAIDGDTAQVGPGIATRLNLTQLTYVSKIKSINTKDQTIIVERKLEEGIEIIEAKLPVLLTVGKEINTPRYATLPNLMKSLKSDPIVWTKNEFNTEVSKLGLNGSPTVVEKIFTPPLRGGGLIIDAKAENFEEKFTEVLSSIKNKVEENRKVVCSI